MEAPTFNPTYQTLYDAGLNRIRKQTARQRALATNAAASRGVNTSGVSELPLDAINAAAVDSEANLSADVAGQQEQERLMDERFAQEKELMGIRNDYAQAAEDRLYKRNKKSAKSALTADLIGAGIGAATSFIPGVGTALAPLAAAAGRRAAY